IRFIVAGNDDNAALAEFALPPGGYGQTITDATNSWHGEDVWNATNIASSYHYGFWWEDLGGGTGRLWQTRGVDYPVTGYSDLCGTVSACVLDSTGSGTVTGWQGVWGFEGVSQRCLMARVDRT